MKTPDCSDFERGTVVVLDTMLKRIDFGFRVEVHGHRVIILNFWHQLPSSE